MATWSDPTVENKCCGKLRPGLHLEDWRQIRSSRIFRNLPPEVALHTLLAGRLRNIDKGETLLYPENRPEAFIFVLQGRIRLFLMDVEGQERSMRFIDEGEMLCPCRNGPAEDGRPDTFAEAAEKTRLLIVPITGFEHVLRQFYDLSLQIIVHLGECLEQANCQACLTKARSATVLVARHLLQQGQGKINLSPISQRARELGMARETLSRTLSRMHDEGIIRYERGCAKIRNHEKLQRLAECI